MTEAEKQLIEAALAWRRQHGPSTMKTSCAMTVVAHAAEDVIRERNRANQGDSTPSFNAQANS